PLARFLELRQGLDTETARQNLDAPQAQLRYAAQLGGTGRNTGPEELERPSRARQVDLCDDRGQTRPDPAKLGQTSIVDESGEVSPQPLESTRCPVVRAHLEGLLSREIEEPCHLMKASRDSEPVESRGHLGCVPEADGRPRQAHLREGPARTRMRGVGHGDALHGAPTVMPKGPRPAMASVDEPLEPEASAAGRCAAPMRGRH